MADNQPRWKVIGASVPGTSHVAAGIVCQDAFAYRILPNGALIAAVADGAGSAKYAEEASRTAADSAIDCLASNCGDSPPGTAEACRGVMEDCLSRVRACLEEKALARSMPHGEAVNLQDFATTLLAVLVTDGIFGALQVGDGAIVCRVPTGELTVAFPPDHGEYLNETCFVTSEGVEKSAHFRIEMGESVREVALLSDGLQMLAIVYRDNTAHGPFFTPLFNFARKEGACVKDLERFLASDRVCERSDDDKTLVLAVRMT